MPTLFLGTHTPKLDDKGRMFLPAKFRERLGDGLVITRGQEHCLYVYTVAEFEKIATEMTSGTTTTSRDVRDYQRVFLSGASDEVPDKQGRLTIPPVLREYAGLSTECTVIGAGNRVEVWDTQTWNSYLEVAEPAFAQRSEEVVPGLI
ncbi:division/cell wall cluster transcriptional repressor MraZ [Ornithinimicrobium sp. Y1847]|uniref:division/cell wall cluster transcriptional repressor MraZ n=1 Tax=unclassified Ornithinimicrobium TaxID=2615080 RepID=UPI003B676F87